MPRSPRLLVFGGREFRDAQAAFRLLDRFASRHGAPEVLIHGGARGADTIGRDWARMSAATKDWAFPISGPDWIRLGKSAGPKRNQRMLDEGLPTHAIGFPGGSGSSDMAERCFTTPTVELFLVDLELRPHRIGSAQDLARVVDGWSLRPTRTRL